mmetsp:Transcript_24151/g.45179  ORF Transcript_24151/g.45179 Transcript_24151/m.45179 type:complete len:97 (-) Transcript_24151:1245-1535(-)
MRTQQRVFATWKKKSAASSMIRKLAMRIAAMTKNMAGARTMLHLHQLGSSGSITSSSGSHWHSKNAHGQRMPQRAVAHPSLQLHAYTCASAMHDYL